MISHNLPLGVNLRFMSPHTNFVGQRADKAIVEGIVGVERVRQPNGKMREGVVKDVNHYTITCDECDGTGYYDERGEVICEDCGLVLSGDRPTAVPYEYGEGDGQGKSRGLGKMGGAPATNEPRVSTYNND